MSISGILSNERYSLSFAALLLSLSGAANAGIVVCKFHDLSCAYNWGPNTLAHDGGGWAFSSATDILTQADELATYNYGGLGSFIRDGACHKEPPRARIDGSTGWAAVCPLRQHVNWSPDPQPAPPKFYPYNPWLNGIYGPDGELACPAGTTFQLVPSLPNPYSQGGYDSAAFECIYPVKIPKISIHRCEGNPTVGNPISPLTGQKTETITTDIILAGKTLKFAYSSLPTQLSAANQSTAYDKEPVVIDGFWRDNFHKFAVPNLINNILHGFTVWRGDGRVKTFGITNSSGTRLGIDYTPYTSTAEEFDDISQRSQGEYLYRDKTAGSEEIFDTTGNILLATSISGRSLHYFYSDNTTPTADAPYPGLLIRIEDDFGRSVKFYYELIAPSSVSLGAKLTKIVDTAGSSISLMVSSGALSSITWQDGHQIGLIYERNDLPGALTGVTDENGGRFSTFSYDSHGMANLSAHAGDANKFSISYSTPPGLSASYRLAANNNFYTTLDWVLPGEISIITPNGQVSILKSAMVNGSPRITSQSQPAGSGCVASTSDQIFDANGNVVQKDDFNGNRVCSAFNTTRNLESMRVEGLTNTASCSGLTGVGAVLPAGSRKISTLWHPVWRIATATAEPGRITTNVYNGQPDPFNGNAIASCAPATALLPDGKPIVVLCKTVDQATIDSDGSQGFLAALQSSVPNRVSTWTYNQFGQTLTAKGPRTDVNDTTNYAYYADTTVEHTLGDLQAVTNAAGQVTRYTKYNKRGQTLEVVDPNGVATTNTYDLRSRLTSTSVGGQTTTYGYDAVGQLIKVTLPDASFIGYEYDAAHRQTAVFDNLGNRIEYTLDNLGNRTAEHVKDSTGALHRQLTRSIDALGRVQQTAGRL